MHDGTLCLSCIVLACFSRSYRNDVCILSAGNEGECQVAGDTGEDPASQGSQGKSREREERKEGSTKGNLGHVYRWVHLVFLCECVCVSVCPFVCELFLCVSVYVCVSMCVCLYTQSLLYRASTRARTKRVFRFVLD